MKLNYEINQCAEILGGELSSLTSGIVTHVVYDSRRITDATGGLFFALNGHQRNGNQFIGDAYQKGIRWFVVATSSEVPIFADAIFIRVEDVLTALQALAKYHRAQFHYPVIGITGSVGKTTFKEWLFHLLSPKFRIVRSPKSFNSQLGVALSLLELHANCDLAIIEAGISTSGEMQALEAMIQPTIGVFTAFGQAHRSNFTNEQEHLNEKLVLFQNCIHSFVSSTIQLSEEQKNQIHSVEFIELIPFNSTLTKGMQPMLSLLNAIGLHLGLDKESILESITHLPQLALRLETFDGINGNTIINDTYNLDSDALREALHYQQRLAGERAKKVIIGLRDSDKSLKPVLTQITNEFQLTDVQFVSENEAFDWDEIHNTVVLIKSSHNGGFNSLVQAAKARTHRTTIEVNLSAIRHNINYIKRLLKSDTQLLCMVKASSYGSGAERVAQFLQHEGIHYFGVAFVDEGVTLRKAGVQLPILVMNADIEYADLMIEYNLEPAIYSMLQLDEFVTTLIRKEQFNYPIHLKFDTGMHRLGFDPKEKETVLAYISAQPEVIVKGIYSHLADADNQENTSFTEQQISTFSEIVSFFKTQLPYSFLAHLLNSEGVLQHTTAQFDLVRLGIALYGYPANESFIEVLQPSLRWLSSVSQVKTIYPNEYVGYGCSYRAEKEIKLAIVPVGYADGFRRSLSNGVGKMYIHGHACAIIGRVCMDMVMVDVTNLNVKENDVVEIIGSHQTMEEFARSMHTIPYEVMTGLSNRMHRVYVED